MPSPRRTAPGPRPATPGPARLRPAGRTRRRPAHASADGLTGIGALAAAVLVGGVATTVYGTRRRAGRQPDAR
ncbi:hypothetical protein [Streptomyces sp. NPDC015345]|uniref:hypothetical protein n=1 Tax=Streptomyces sp. NPDC015345 TaxID=3364953 RepID=UPI0037034584